MMRAPHPDWIVPDWPAPARVRALATTRAGGVSTGAHASLNLGSRVGDDPARVAQNRALLRECLPTAPRWIRQVHGTRVVDLDAPACGAAEEPEADAAVSRAPGTVCAILTADCIPVLLCDRAGTVVAAAHAGWRGLAAGVLETAIGAMGAAPETLIAWLGPAIGPASYEVGPELRAAFVARDPRAAGAFASAGADKYFADLYAFARLRLRALGVGEIRGGGYCTRTDERFFSFRRAPITGRMATLIWLQEQ